MKEISNTEIRAAMLELKRAQEVVLEVVGDDTTKYVIHGTLSLRLAELTTQITEEVEESPEVETLVMTRDDLYDLLTRYNSIPDLMIDALFAEQ